MSGEERSNEAPRRSDYVLVPGPESAQIMIDALRSRLAAVERERDETGAKLFQAGLALVNEQLRSDRVESERDAAVAENARLLARIAAVEARAADVDLIRRAIADPGQFVSRARWSADPGFAGESIASWSARAAVAVLAASPTPTGPERCPECNHEPGC